jgi:DNA replication protein DnaC
MEELTVQKERWLTKRANIPIRYQGWTKERIVNDMGKFPQAIDSWIDAVLTGEVIKSPGTAGTTGLGLLFDGGPGLGKTTHAVVAAMELIRRMPDDDVSLRKLFHIRAADFGEGFIPVYYTTFPEFLSLKKKAFDAEPDEKRAINGFIEGLHGRSNDDGKNVRILVLDDLGKEFGSQYNDTSFDELLRSRYDKGLPTIITTNVLRELWSTQYSEAMGSFAYEAFSHVKLSNADLRKRKNV